MHTRRVFGGAAALSLAAYFLLLAGAGLTVGFSHDDLMNMYGAARLTVWEEVRDTVVFFRYSDVYRPAGALFYRAIYDQFGFHPLAFRVASFVLLGLNLALGYAVARRLSGSAEVGALTALLFAFHGEMAPLYLSTGFIYDILCLTFYCGALLVYVRAREGGRLPTWGAMAAWTVLYVLCLNSKEMAVTLPVMIGLWEWLTQERRSWRVTVWGGLMTAAFLVGRLWLPDNLLKNPEYAPHLSAWVYLDRVEHFLWFVVYRAKWFAWWHAAAFGVFVCAVAVLWRNAEVRWAAFWMVVSVLPIAFINQRSLAAAYIPFLALAFFLAQAIWGVAGRAVGPVAERAVGPLAAQAVGPVAGTRVPFAALFVCLLGLLFHVHRKHSPMPVHVERGEHVHIMRVAGQLGAWRQQLRCARSILFVEDPFPRFEWNSFFLVSLLAMDPTVKSPACDGETPSYTAPDRVRIPKRLRERYQPGDVVRFELALTYEDGEIKECGAGAREWRWSE